MLASALIFAVSGVTVTVAGPEVLLFEVMAAPVDMLARLESALRAWMNANLCTPMPSAPKLSVLGLKYCCSATMVATVVTSFITTTLDEEIWLH